MKNLAYRQPGLLVYPLKDTQTATILIGVRCGSRDEQPRQAGMAHFIEHLFFKGTQKRPSYLEISRELDSLGGHYNAFTSHEMTGFYIQANFEKQLPAAEILGDMLFNPTFPEPEILKEKQVIAEEINMYEDIPQHKAGLEFQQLMFPDSSLGRAITGSKKTVQSFERRGLRNFMHTHYIPRNLVVAVAGKIDKKLIDFIGQRFFLGQGKGQEFQPLPYSKANIPSQASQRQNRTKTIHKKTDQAHLVLGFPGLSSQSPQRFCLGLLSRILGGMMSSRLFTEVREKQGLAYYINSSASFFMDTGALEIRAGLAKSKLEQGMEIIRQELKKFKRRPVSSQELQRAKDNFKGQLYLGLEDSLEVAQFYLTQQLLVQEILSPAEIIQRVEKVSPNDILKLANILFEENKEKLVIVK